METEQEKQAHKELHKKIYNCEKKCFPFMKGEPYCNDCSDAILEFADKYGAGVLTRDEHLEELEKYCREIDECNSRQADTILELKHKINELKEKCRELGRDALK